MTKVNTDLNKENEITRITFDHEGAHLALTHKLQGYGANGRPEALLIKSDDIELNEEVLQDVELIKAGDPEVRIETTMFMFLHKWMGLFFDDADMLSQILGFEGHDRGRDIHEEFIEERIEGITLLKAACEGVIRQEAKKSEVNKLSEFIKTNEVAFKDSLSEGNPDVKTEKNKSDRLISHKPSENNLKSNQGDTMSATDLEKLDKAQEDLDAMTTKLEAFEKGAKEAKDVASVMSAKIESFEKASTERMEKAFQNKVALYSFITEDERKEFAKTLIALDSEAIVDALDKAQAAINSVEDIQGVDSDASSTTETSSMKEKVIAKYGDNK